MSWTFNGIRIYPQTQQESEKQLIARLNPQGGGTILHRFGDDEPIERIEAKVLTSGDLASLKLLAGSATSYELVSPEGSLGDWILNSIESSREMSSNHIFFDRPNVANDAPLYSVVMELYSDI